MRSYRSIPLTSTGVLRSLQQSSLYYLQKFPGLRGANFWRLQTTQGKLVLVDHEQWKTSQLLAPEMVRLSLTLCDGE